MSTLTRLPSASRHIAFESIFWLCAGASSKDRANAAQHCIKARPERTMLTFCTVSNNIRKQCELSRQSVQTSEKVSCLVTMRALCKKMQTSVKIRRKLLKVSEAHFSSDPGILRGLALLGTIEQKVLSNPTSRPPMGLRKEGSYFCLSFEISAQGINTRQMLSIPLFHNCPFCPLTMLFCWLHTCSTRYVSPGGMHTSSKAVQVDAKYQN